MKSETGFKRVSDSQRVTRVGDEPLYIRGGPARLEIRRHFFSQRVIEDWNKILVDICKIRQNGPGFLQRLYC